MFLVDTLGGGGAEKACLNIASEFSNENQVTVVAIFDEPDADYSFSDRVTIERLNMVVGGSIVSKMKAYQNAYRKLHDLKKKYRIDCCISFLETANYLNCMCPAGDKKIISIRNYYSLSINTSKRIRTIKAKIASTLAHKVVCVSDAVRKNMIENYNSAPGKTLTVYNYIDEPQPKNSPRGSEKFQQFQNLIRESSVSFITVGRLSYQKGHVHLIRSFRKVVSAVPKARLFILGQGELMDDLKSLVKISGLEDSIHFLGFDLQIDQYLEKSDVFVSSSLYEGMSNAMLEAMASGLPVIAADCPSGPREILAPGTDISRRTRLPEMAAYGILTPVCSGCQDLSSQPLDEPENILADMMIKIASDQELRKQYSEKSFWRSKDFRKEIMIERWRKLITVLVAPSQRQ